jgi:mRNA-degrading endonuclease RelE of RelBE toxin-antitoxin system
MRCRLAFGSVLRRRSISWGASLPGRAHHRLQGTDAFRLRVGDYRVIYDFDLKKQRLDLLFVGHRREIYKGL